MVKILRVSAFSLPEYPQGWALKQRVLSPVEAHTL